MCGHPVWRGQEVARSSTGGGVLSGLSLRQRGRAAKFRQPHVCTECFFECTHVQQDFASVAACTIWGCHAEPVRVRFPCSLAVTVQVSTVVVWAALLWSCKGTNKKPCPL